ncbi:MAG: MerR family transcriptional regulator [Myxococcota bacterium]
MDTVESSMRSVPEKSYFRIGEVAKLTGVKPYVLRYWETEFKAMIPPKSRSRQRMYRRRDIETILRIKHLLYQERFTIEGARKRLAELQRGADPGSPSASDRRDLARLREELEDIRGLLAEA